ncbi:purine nucleoside phosphorylase LACC1 [Cololabis saira]|uniref:purine nucleoside phosphorylase LACC1 n=1 Tax=Cololabis saira TaxID=129043 RepID=UPI002AD4416D|nr:purine nucleoside phosphorylase LACC1 [Cololabis saira]
MLRVSPGPPVCSSVSAPCQPGSTITAPCAMAVLLDLLHGCPHEDQLLLLQDSDLHVFLLTADPEQRSFLPDQTPVIVLEQRSPARALYGLKLRLDQLQLSRVRVVTSPRGRGQLARYQQLLFTAVYTFDYTEVLEDKSTCPSCGGHAHPDSPAGSVQEDVSALVQQLPALGGDMRVLTSALIPDCFGHGFSTRAGGVSCIPTLSSLNLFSSSRRRDPPAVVMENRRRLALHAGFHPLPLRLVKVNHASDVWVLGKAEPESYDAMVTDQPGVVLAAPGADCMPILFADPVRKVIGAAHAGWKGTVMGVAMATVNAMVTDLGSRLSDIVVAVGPAVGVCCFTLDREQALDFTSIHPDCVPDPESARPHVDIRLANRVLLQRGGILPEHIHDNAVTNQPCISPCTSCHPKDFFSHVRDGLNFGTQVGFLWIRGTEDHAGPLASQTG